jgi:cell division protein FtsW (lipid II flippase)
MVNKHMRNIFSSVIMTLLMLLTVVSTTIVGATISSSNAIPLNDLSEESEKTIFANETMLVIPFVFIIADAVIKYKLPYNYIYCYLCSPVEKVTVIGFGDYQNDSEFRPRFFMKTFTNVSGLIFYSYKFDTSQEYQHISSFVTPRTDCILLFNNSKEMNRRTIV